MFNPPQCSKTGLEYLILFYQNMISFIMFNFYIIFSILFELTSYDALPVASLINWDTKISRDSIFFFFC